MRESRSRRIAKSRARCAPARPPRVRPAVAQPTRDKIVGRTASGALIVAKSSKDSASVGVADRRGEARTWTLVDDLPFIERGRRAPGGGHPDNLSRVLEQILGDHRDASYRDVLKRIREQTAERPKGYPIIAVGPVPSGAVELPPELQKSGLAADSIAWYRPRKAGVQVTTYPQLCRKITAARHKLRIPDRRRKS